MFDFFKKKSTTPVAEDPTEIRGKEVCEAAMALVRNHSIMETDPAKALFVVMNFSLGAESKDKGLSKKEAFEKGISILKEADKKNGGAH